MSNLIAPGMYKVKAVEWDLRETGKGVEQFWVKLELLDHPGQFIDWWLGFASDKAEAFSVRALRALGWVGADIRNVKSLSTERIATVIHETHEGTTRAKVKYVSDDGGPTVKKLEGEKRDVFAERLKAKIEIMDAKAGSEVPPRTGTDDDIPF